MSKDNVHKILLFSASALAKNYKEILLQNENPYMLTIHYSNGIFLVKQFEVPLQISNKRLQKNVHKIFLSSAYAPAQNFKEITDWALVKIYN